MRSCAGEVATSPAPGDVLAIVTQDTYESVLADALACGGGRLPRLTVFTYVPSLLIRHFAALAGHPFTLDELTAEVRSVELAAHRLVPAECSVMFIGGTFRPWRELRALVTAIEPGVIVAGHGTMARGWVRAAAVGRGASLLPVPPVVPAS